MLITVRKSSNNYGVRKLRKSDSKAKKRMNEEHSVLESTIVSEGFKGGTRGSPIMPRDAVSRTANVQRNGGHKWVKWAKKKVKKRMNEEHSVRISAQPLFLFTLFKQFSFHSEQFSERDFNEFFFRILTKY